MRQEWSKLPGWLDTHIKCNHRHPLGNRRGLKQALTVQIVSGGNFGKIKDAVGKIKKFLDGEGAEYQFHESGNSDSQYFVVEREGDRVSPEVDVRVSDHDLPGKYTPPDIDVDPGLGRTIAYSVGEAIGLLRDFLDGTLFNIVYGEPVEASIDPALDRYRQYLKEGYGDSEAERMARQEFSITGNYIWDQRGLDSGTRLELEIQFNQLSAEYLGIPETDVMAMPGYRDKVNSFVHDMFEWGKLSEKQRETAYLNMDRTLLMQSVVYHVHSQPIFSFTVAQLLNEEDMELYHRGEYKAELQAPWFVKAYGSTALYNTKSSERFGANKVYTQKILFKDFVVIAKDKQIPIKDAIEYAIESGDVSVRCNCPSFLYHGFAYISTQLAYLYGLPRENRFPKIRNPNLRSSMCKHLSRVLGQISGDASKLEMAFENLYRKVEQPWLNLYNEPGVGEGRRDRRRASPNTTPEEPGREIDLTEPDYIPMEDAAGQPELFAEGDGSGASLTDTSGEGMFEQQGNQEQEETEEERRRKREAFVTDWAMERQRRSVGRLQLVSSRYLRMVN